MPSDGTTISVTSVSPTSVLGQPATFTALITPTSPSGVSPTGTVYFFDGFTLLGSQTVGNSSASLTTSALALGTHAAITAAYVPDANSSSFFSPSGLSAPLTETIVSSIGTSITVSSSSSTSVMGQPVTFTALITPTDPTSVVPTGTVYFFDGYSLLGSQTVNDATVSLTTSSLSVGTHAAITAAYVPDAAGSATFSPSGLSADLTETILPQDGTSVTLASSAPVAVIGQSVTFTAFLNLAAPSNASSTGLVYFFDGMNLLGSQTISNDMAALTTSSLTLGTHAHLTAAYVPDAAGSVNFQASGLSAPLTETIESVDNTTITVSASSPTAAVGQPVTLTAVIAPTAANTAVPTGTVYFFDGLTLLGSQTVSNGMAALTTSSLSVGTHSSITAAYVPDAASTDVFGPSGLSAPLTETVLANPMIVPADSTTVTLKSTAPLAIAGQSITFAAIITPTTSTTAVPTGTVYFFDGLTFLGSQTVSNGMAALTTSSLSVGTHSSITAAYDPDAASSANFQPSGLSAPLTETIGQVPQTLTTVYSSPNISYFGQSVTITALVTPVAATRRPGGRRHGLFLRRVYPSGDRHRPERCGDLHHVHAERWHSRRHHRGLRPGRSQQHLFRSKRPVCSLSTNRERRGVVSGGRRSIWGQRRAVKSR